MIRQITTYEEILAAATVMKGFEQASSHVKVDPTHSANTYFNLVSAGIAVFFVMEKDGEMIGGLGALKAPDLHYNRIMAVETFWFVSPQHRGQGLQLFDAFEQWGAENGCNALAMIHMADSYPAALEKFYARKGYKLAEKHYIKEI